MRTKEDVHTAVVRLQLSVFTFARQATSIGICRERWVSSHQEHPSMTTIFFTKTFNLFAVLKKINLLRAKQSDLSQKIHYRVRFS